LTPSQRSNLDIVAVAADPYYEKVSDVQGFIARYHLAQMANFHFVTGSLHAMQAVWRDYGIQVEMRRTDKMSVHTDVVYVIDPNGIIRATVPDDPVSGAGIDSAVTELTAALANTGLA
jgi:cytochrome oxidase Cu insertion factor (SCO1/SenC/PrrC family)